MEIRILSDEKGLSPLDVLMRRIPAAPAVYLRRLLRAGKVRSGKTPLTEQSRLPEGEVLLLPRSSRLLALIEASKGEDVEILFESREILAVYKPPGLAMHRSAGHEADNLALRVEKMMARRGEPFRTSPVHRLDLETSGPVLFAKGRRAASELGKAFMAGAAQKVYLGLASGRLEGAAVLTSPVRAKGKLKEAATELTPLAASGGFTLLELRLGTGRTHQIRRQLADAGYPLAGDRRYGGAPLPRLQRLFLHCRRLALPNPFDPRPLELDSPLPADLAEVLKGLGLDPARSDGRTP